MNEALNIVTAGANISLGSEFNGGVLTAIWVVAIFIGIFTYARSKGKVGPAIMAFLGAGVIATAVAYPKLLTQGLPSLFKVLINEVLRWFGQPPIA